MEFTDMDQKPQKSSFHFMGSFSEDTKRQSWTSGKRQTRDASQGQIYQGRNHVQKTHALRVIEAFTACYYSSIRPLCCNSSKVVLLFFTSVLPGFDTLLPQALSASGKRCESTGKCMRGYFYLHGNEPIDKYRSEGGGEGKSTLRWSKTSPNITTTLALAS